MMCYRLIFYLYACVLFQEQAYCELRRYNERGPIKVHINSTSEVFFFFFLFHEKLHSCTSFEICKQKAQLTEMVDGK